MSQLGGTFDQKLFEFIDPRFFQNNTAVAVVAVCIHLSFVIFG